MTDDGTSVAHVSGSLRAYARGELDDASRRDVDRHLSLCRDCRAELAAVRMLAAHEAEALTDIERARIRDAVRRTTTPSVARTRHFGGIAAALGAAALVAVAVVFAHVSGSGGGGSSAAENAINAPAQGSAGGGAGVQNGANDAASGVQAAGPPPSPLFEHHAALTTTALKSEGSAAPVFRAFARYYDSADAVRLTPVLTKELADQAHSHAVSSQIQRCAHTVLRNERHPALPAYASATSIKHRPALVLGFAWTPLTRGPLDHYMFWAWHRSECGVPITYETGNVKR